MLAAEGEEQTCNSIGVLAAVVVEERWEGYTEAESVAAVVGQAAVVAAAEAAADVAVAVDTHAPYHHATLFHSGQAQYPQHLD